MGHEVYDNKTGTHSALPFREPIPPSLLKEMTKMVKVAKRFPRAVLFIGDYVETKIGNDYSTWQRELRVKFHELGWPHV